MKVKLFRIFFLTAVLMMLMTAVSFSQTKISYPIAKKTGHTDVYFGTVVSDPYVWMEDMQSEEVTQWVKEENELTESYISAIPYRENIRERITQLWNYKRYESAFRAGDYYFYYENNGLQDQSVLFYMKGVNGIPEVFLDPNKLSKDGTTAISGTSISWDNKYFGFTLSVAGSDWDEIHVIDIETGTMLKDTIRWVKFSGINWDGEGFYYSRYDEPTGDLLKDKNESPKIYYHKLGTDQSDDQLIFFDEKNPESLVSIYKVKDDHILFRSVYERGAEGNKMYYRDQRFSGLNEFPLNENNNVKLYPITVAGDDIILYTNIDAVNYNILKYNMVSKEFTEFIPEGKEPLKGFQLVGGKYIAEYLEDGHSKIVVYDFNGKFLNEISFPAVGYVSDVRGREEDNELFYTFSTFNYPPTIYRYDVETNTSVLFKRDDVNIDPEVYVNKQVFYPSKDGTMIPMFIVHKKGLEMNGNNPVLLYGYGGFNISETPNFSSTRLLFLEHGGIYAQACLRGGGEYGENWHKAGMQLNKQNVFDDFIYAAEYLNRENYTNSGKLAIMGGSNGGLLVGAVINQRPDLFKVALPAVGVMDMLKYHKFTIGWAWVSDYGSSDDPVHFENIYSYSPLHNIKPQKYPATLITTSDHDDRVVPLHSFKYAATLQEMNTGGNPILLRVETDAGHGAGIPLSKSIAEKTDLYSFIFFNLGIDFNQY